MAATDKVQNARGENDSILRYFLDFFYKECTEVVAMIAFS